MSKSNKNDKKRNEYLYKSPLDRQKGESEEDYLRQLWFLRKALLDEYKEIASFQTFDSEDKRDSALGLINDRVDNIDKVLKEHRFPSIGFKGTQEFFNSRFGCCPPQEIAIWVYLGELHAYKQDDLIQPLVASELNTCLEYALGGLFFDPVEIIFFDPNYQKNQGRWLTYVQLLERWTGMGNTQLKIEKLIKDTHEDWKKRDICITQPGFSPCGFHPATGVADSPEEGMYNLRQIEDYEQRYFKATLSVKLAEIAGYEPPSQNNPPREVTLENQEQPSKPSVESDGQEPKFTREAHTYETLNKHGHWASLWSESEIKNPGFGQRDHANEVWIKLGRPEKIKKETIRKAVIAFKQVNPAAGIKH